jgi:2-polyprenyl-3-methyl-5-hydroxy-6-metoxy-1,4-benzoquinol methylase
VLNVEVVMKKSNNESLEAWEKNAEFWDEYMGDDSNFFHNDMVRPDTEKFLDINKGDYVLDIACGNGNFSKRLVELGAKVMAFDYSEKMIELAKNRRKDYLDKIDFRVCDAIDYSALIKLKGDELYDKAVANMAIMDISDIRPLFKAVSQMLKKDGVFVFATHHPCFTYPNNNYLDNSLHKGVAIEKQPVLQNYYHRSISEIFNIGFENEFSVEGFEEIPFHGEVEPIIMIVKMKKNK